MISRITHAVSEKLIALYSMGASPYDFTHARFDFCYWAKIRYSYLSICHEQFWKGRGEKIEERETERLRRILCLSLSLLERTSARKHKEAFLILVLSVSTPSFWLPPSSIFPYGHPMNLQPHDSMFRTGQKNWLCLCFSTQKLDTTHIKVYNNCKNKIVISSTK